MTVRARLLTAVVGPAYAGPSFRFETRVALQVEAMPRSFVTPRGTANVRELVLRDIPEIATSVAALRAGEIQIAYPINADVADQVRSQNNLEIRIDRGSAQNHVAFNLQEPHFQDLRVRQALNHAINRDVIISQVLGGFAEKNDTLVGNEVLGNPTVPGYAYDVSRARQLMQQAGWAQGFRVPMRFSPAFGQNPAAAIAADLARINVQVELQQIESAVWSVEYRGTQDRRPGLFVGTTNWEQTFEPDVVWRWWSSDIALTGGRRWSDERFDQLYQTAKATVNEQQRGQRYQEAGRYLWEQAPVIFLWRNFRPGGAVRNVQWQPGLFADAFVSGLAINQ